MALAGSQSNRPRLAALPEQLPATQAAWERFWGALQGWRRTLSSPTWITPTLQNGWSNYDAGTGPHEPAGYYMDFTGRVYLRGLVKGGTLGSTSPIFTLPTGFIPAYEYSAIANSLDAACSMRVGGVNDSAVTPGAVVISSGGNNTWVSLSGISFSTTP